MCAFHQMNGGRITVCQNDGKCHFFFGKPLKAESLHLGPILIVLFQFHYVERQNATMYVIVQTIIYLTVHFYF